MKKPYLALLACIIATPALATDKITVLQAVQLSTALRNLDGHMVVIKQNGADATVMVPWDFGSGSLRLRIANNITILDASLKASEDARQAIIKELLRKASERAGATVAEIKPDMPENAEFQKQYGDMTTQPAAGTQDLSRIKASELRLDKNEIAVTVLSALGPIMDNDVPK